MISNIGEGATPLMYACQQSREKEVIDLIARKRSSVCERDRTLKTPLHYCTENATVGCAEQVLRAAPELLDAKDEDGYTALHLAVIAGNRTFLRFLISRGANVNALDNERHSAVHWATVCGEEEALEIILRAGANISTADVHGGYPLHYAAQMCGPGGEMDRDPKIGLRILNILLSHDIDINVEDKDGRQPILWAASAGSADAILSLVKAGASVEAADKDGLTALHCAASRGHTDCIETLVTLCGANIDVIDSNGCTALFYAVTLGHADASQLLLSLGAEPNRQDRKGRTPAHCGAAKGQLETLRILLNYGANLWLRNVKGDFPLHEAIASGRRDLVRWLLNQRPDSINVGNNDGRCPIHIAAINNNIDMIKILLDAQSLVNPIMRTTKGSLMTPLDAAIHRGFRGCAKYIQLHGGVPFTKLTEKSSNIRGISSRQITSEMYAENYGDRLGVSNWGMRQTSTDGYCPVQIRMGGDNAIQQIETTDVRAVTRIPDDCEDFRSSDEERVYRRRRRRKKWEHQRKGYISEESNGEDVPRGVDHPRRRQRTAGEESRPRKKREQYEGSSSENDFYTRKTMKKKDSGSDSDERRNHPRVVYSDRRRYHSATEDSENERKGERKRKSGKESSNRSRSESENSKREKSEVAGNAGNPQSGKSGENQQSTIVEVHKIPVEVNDKKVEEHDNTTDEQDNTADVHENRIEVQENMVEVHENRIEEQENGVEVHENPVEVQESMAESIPYETVPIEDRTEEPEPEENEPVEPIQVPEVTEEVITSATTDALSASVEQSEIPPPEPEEPIVKIDETQPEFAEEIEKNPSFNEEETGNQEEVKEAKAEELEDPEKNPETPNVEDNIPEEVNEVPRFSEGIEEKEDLTEEAQDVSEEFMIETDRKEEVEDHVSEMVPAQEEEYEEVEDEENPENDYGENAFEVLDNIPNSAGSNRTSYSRSNSRRNLNESETSMRGSDSGHREYRSGDPDGSLGDESGASTRNEDSSALMDSGIEPSPRRRLRDAADGHNSGTRTRVPRLCNRGKEPEEVHSVSVTQTVQNTIRKYHMERRIFYQLLELKRLQIRAGRANEQLLVKRLVDDYRRGGIIPGLKNYTGQYMFRQFEKFLYDQLRTLQSTAHILIPNLRPSDDIETLSTILRKSRVELVDDTPDNPMFCTQGTHRCHHAAHAYTGIPCAAYITKLNHHEMPKTKPTGFLPHIEQNYTDRSFTQHGSSRPVTLEVSHGKEKQVISLPTDRLDKNKRYYVTFTIKGGPPLEESKSPENEERILRHRHAKSF